MSRDIYVVTAPVKIKRTPHLSGNPIGLCHATVHCTVMTIPRYIVNYRCSGTFVEGVVSHGARCPFVKSLDFGRGEGAVVDAHIIYFAVECFSITQVIGAY